MKPPRPVIVLPYDDTWPASYEEEAGIIAARLGLSGLSLHHIGSTSVPGLHAKPVIDMVGEVDHIEQMDDHNPAMVDLGYTPMGEYGLPRRRFFMKDTDGVRSHHVHMYQRGDPEITRHLVFRDYLRSHLDAAQAYGDLKSKLAAAHPDDMEAYISGKHDLIQALERKALMWGAQLG